ncbi:Kelch-like protein 28 [Manis javanica]|nr:Kelch-like protein 28 [Manis javanica]
MDLGLQLSPERGRPRTAPKGECQVLGGLAGSLACDLETASFCPGNKDRIGLFGTEQAAHTPLYEVGQIVVCMYLGNA